MTLTPLQQALQMFSFFSALVQLILALYILGLNVRHTANRLVSTLFMVLSMNSMSMGLLLGATAAHQIRTATLFLAATNPLIGPLLFVIAIFLLHPEWFRGRGRGGWYLLLVLTVLPLPLTFVDAVWNTNLWYTGVPADYAGGFVSLHEYAGGSLGLPIRILSMYAMPFLTLAPLLYIGFWEKPVASEKRTLAIWLMGAQVGALVIQFGLWPVLSAEAAIMATNTVFAVLYGYVAFRQMLSERRLQRGSLRVRLTALMLSIALPILVSVVLLLINQARALLEQTEFRRLEAINRSLVVHTDSWLNFNIGALEQLTEDSQIILMDQRAQAPVLRAVAAAYPHISLVSTVDATGMNVARSDTRLPLDYSSRQWFLEILAGEPGAFQVLASRSLGRTALVIALPIRDTNERLLGAVMMEIALTDIVRELQLPPVGEGGIVYLVDSEDNVVAHPDTTFIARVNRISNPAVDLLRAGERGDVRFDWSGELWWGHINALDNGWGVVVQQPEAEIMASLQQFRQITLVILGAGAALIFVFLGLAVRQAFAPIIQLTETAIAIAEGDITRTAPVQSADEIGTLAEAFNSMTAQLRESIASLEHRVADRTRELERRAEYLAVTAGVSRVVASILDVDDLLERVVTLISERFDFYHTGIFLLDVAGEWAVLRTVSSEGGRRMLERGHRLRVGEQGIVGYVSGTGRPRIALDVDEDTVWVENPDLPLTRSEMALPLVIGEQVIGVLDVQSTEAEAFTMEDVTTLQILADQIAVAIQNARLFRESQQSLREMQRAYGRQVREGWERRILTQVGYQYTPAGGGRSLAPDSAHAVRIPEGAGHRVLEDNTLLVPLRLVGGVSFGALRLRRDLAHPWLSQEIDFVVKAAQDIAQALEVARLFEETRSRAARDRLVGEIGAELRASLDPDTIIKTTLQELGQVLGAQLAAVEITGPQSRGAGDGSGAVTRSTGGVDG